MQLKEAFRLSINAKTTCCAALNSDGALATKLLEIWSAPHFRGSRRYVWVYKYQARWLLAD